MMALNEKGNAETGRVMPCRLADRVMLVMVVMLVSIVNNCSSIESVPCR